MKIYKAKNVNLGNKPNFLVGVVSALLCHIFKWQENHFNLKERKECDLAITINLLDDVRPLSQALSCLLRSYARNR